MSKRLTIKLRPANAFTVEDGEITLNLFVHEIVDAVTEEELLDEIGAGECVQHFGNELLEIMGKDWCDLYFDGEEPQ